MCNHSFHYKKDYHQSDTARQYFHSAICLLMDTILVRNNHTSPLLR